MLDGRVVLAVLIGACAASQTPVPMVGTAGDVSALSGKWMGEYFSVESGRSGSISFTLNAKGDSAAGDVVMVPSGMGQPLAPWRGAAGDAQQARPVSEVLTINFVRVQSGRVYGTLAPYADPGTGARLLTTFTGDLKGNTIEGMYTTRLPSGEIQTGQWRVQRS